MSRNRTANWEDYAIWIVKEYIHMYDWVYYTDLILKLHEISFYSYIDDDDNRAKDGLYLRNYFIEDMKGKIIDDEILENDASVLEVLAALAVRLDHEYIGDHMVETPEDFNEKAEYVLFAEMLDNLELLDYQGELDSEEEEDIENIIDHWLVRDFDMRGGGSIFPLSHTRRDQRFLSIWEQAMEYIKEKKIGGDVS